MRDPGDPVTDDPTLRRTTRAGRIRRGLSVTILALIIVGNIIGYCQARAMTHFERSGTKTLAPEKLSRWDKLRVLITGITLIRPSSTHVPSDLGPDCEAFTIKAPDGPTLAAWHWPVSNATTLIVLLHGYDSDKASMMHEARVLHQLGCSTLLLDFRGSWESSESYTTIGVMEALDVTATMSYARQRWPNHKIVLYGQSMGAAAILRAIAVNHIAPDGIVIDAVFDSLLNTVRNRFHLMNVPSWPGAELLTFWGGIQFGFNGFANNPTDYAQAVTMPALFLHGAADPRARIDDGRRVFNAVSTTNKTMTVFPKLAHQSALVAYPVQWTAAFSNFLGSLNR